MRHPVDLDKIRETPNGDPGGRMDMAAEDRRTRRTKRLLKDALVALVLEHGYDNVTVEDITEHADLSRATFYKYHRDKQALLEQIVNALPRDLSERLAPLTL